MWRILRSINCWATNFFAWSSGISWLIANIPPILGFLGLTGMGTWFATNISKLSEYGWGIYPFIGVLFALVASLAFAALATGIAYFRKDRKANANSVRRQETHPQSPFPPADLEKWEHVHYFAIWQVAFLWEGLEPHSPQQAANPNSATYRIWKQLRQAALEDKTLALVDQQDEVITVRRDELKKYAEDVARESPEFLFPSDRAGKTNLTKTRYNILHGVPWKPPYANDGTPQ